MQTENIYTKKGQNQAFMTELSKFMEYTPEQQDAAIQDLFEFLDAVEEINRVTKKAEKLFDDPHGKTVDRSDIRTVHPRKLIRQMFCVLRRFCHFLPYGS